MRSHPATRELKPPVFDCGLSRADSSKIRCLRQKQGHVPVHSAPSPFLIQAAYRLRRSCLQPILRSVAAAPPLQNPCSPEIPLSQSAIGAVPDPDAIPRQRRNACTAGYSPKSCEEDRASPDSRPACSSDPAAVSGARFRAAVRRRAVRVR